MDRRNRIGLYGAYFLGVSGIGFTLPFLPLFLGDADLDDRTIGIISTLAALVGLLQFPVGLWSDRVGRRKPFLIAALALLALATLLLRQAEGVVALTVLVLLFAENGCCRATVESLAGAEATQLAPPGGVGAALGALRFWKPVGIVLVALGGGFLARHYGVAAVLGPLALVQGLAVVAALLIREHPERGAGEADGRVACPTEDDRAWLRDRAVGLFVVAMVLFHFANAPGGVYLGLFMRRQLGAPPDWLALAFVVSMVTWMLVVRPIGWLADRVGRRPLLLLGWAAAAARLALIAAAAEAWQILAIQVLDGFASGLFSVLAGAWMADRLGDSRRAGTAQALVGTSLVFGSALGPLAAGLLVEDLGYRTMFALLAGVATAATAVVALAVPETLTAPAATPELAPAAGQPLSLEKQA